VDKGQILSHLWIEKGNPRINILLVRGFFFRNRYQTGKVFFLPV